MEKPNDLELLAATVMIPPLLWDDLLEGTSEAELLTGTDMKKYRDELDDFAFCSVRDYEGFRRFLDGFSALYGERFLLLKQIQNNAIDYVLDRVKEERIKKLFEEL